MSETEMRQKILAELQAHKINPMNLNYSTRLIPDGIAS